MQHHYDGGYIIKMKFELDPAQLVENTSQNTNLDLGQDLSHFPHRARRSFMQSVHKQKLQGAHHKDVCTNLAAEAYYQHLQSLGFNIVSIKCQTKHPFQLFDEQELTIYQYCVTLSIPIAQ